MTQSNSNHENDSAENLDKLNIVYDPTSLEMMKTLGGVENPPPSEIQHVSGSIHTRLADLEDYLGLPEPGAMVLPATVPILNSDLADPLQREAVHGIDLVLQDKERCTHLMVIGQTGSGKNVTIIDPLRASAIADPGHSVISVGLKAADIGPIGKMCKEAGKRHVILNLTNPERSTWWNPLETDDPDEARDIIRRFADAGKNPYSNDSDFWSQWVRCGVQGCWEEGIRSFPLILEFFSQPYDTVIEQLRHHNNPNSNRLGEYLKGHSHNADTVFASIFGTLSSLISRKMMKVLSKNELDLKKIFRNPICLHIEVNEAQLETQRPMLQLLMSCVIDSLISTCESMGYKKRAITIFFDDLPSLGCIISPQRLLTLRSRGIGVVAGVQSISSIELAYSANPRAFFEAFRHKIVLPGCSEPDANNFSNASGESFVMLAGHEGQSPVFNRPLISSTEIRRPNYRHPLLGLPATLFFGPVAFQAYLQKFYEIPKYARILRVTKGVTGQERLRRKLPACPTLADVCQNVSNSNASAKITGITNTIGWTNDQIKDKLASVEFKIGCQSIGNTSAGKWWQAFKKENDQKISLVLRLSEEILIRNATITDFFLAYVYSNTDDIQANLFYLDYTRLKKEGEMKKREDIMSKLSAPLDDSSDDQLGEVDFIRCENCKSLVPGEIIRCMICGDLR